ncbi:MAG: hypothetical protein ACE5DL_01260 [Nitrosopumilaceae archaeon]
MRFIGISPSVISLDKKIPLDDVTPVEIQCTSCLLPMQYQNKIKGKFLWQCFKCGKKYFVEKTPEKYLVEETWSLTK